MPKDSYYFKHDSNASSDLKLKALRKKHGWQGMGWYWFLIETLRNEDDYRLEYCEFTFESLAEDMKIEVAETQKYIDDCIDKFHLLAKRDGFFFSERLIRDMAHLDDIRQKTREAGKKSAEVRAEKSTEQASTTRKPDPKADISDELRAEFSELDIEAEFKKFTLYWSEGKRKLQRPKTAFRNWLLKAREFKQEKQPAKSARRTYDDGLEGMKIE